MVSNLFQDHLIEQQRNLNQSLPLTYKKYKDSLFTK
jgi:hypothetical protein